MHVPSAGLTRDERAIVREGYRLAERMLRDYRDTPAGPAARVRYWLAACRREAQDFYRACVRG